MSYVHVQPLANVESEFLVIRQAVAQALLDVSRPDHASLSQAAAGLETAYVARLLSVFEGTLRDYLATSDPRRRTVPRRVFDAINRAASIWRIPYQIRDDVHEARVYRNSVVHPDGATRAAIPLSEARSRLSKFLARLP